MVRVALHDEDILTADTERTTRERRMLHEFSNVAVWLSDCPCRKKLNPIFTPRTTIR